MPELFRQKREGLIEVVVLDVGFGPCVGISLTNLPSVIVSLGHVEIIHECLTETVRFLELHTDQQAQSNVEAATADLDDQIALSFDDVSAEKDGGVSAEVVRTLKGA